MARVDYWNVKVPESPEPFATREQVWAALAAAASKVGDVLRRAALDAWSGLPGESSPLDEGEGKRVARAARRLDLTVGWLSKDVIERVADLAPVRQDGTQYTPAVDALYDDYHGDFRLWLDDLPVENNVEEIQLAISLLERAGYDSVTSGLLSLLSKQDDDTYERDCRWRKKGEAQRDRRHVHVCPWCAGEAMVRDPNGRVPSAKCTRCSSNGYIVQKGRPSDYDYEMSDEGKWALNAGRPWALEDEKRVMRDELGYTDGEIREQLANRGVEGTQ